MEAEKKPRVKPRNLPETNGIGPAPPLPSHRMFKPFTENEVNQVIANAPAIVSNQVGTTSKVEDDEASSSTVAGPSNPDEKIIVPEEEENEIEQEEENDYHNVVQARKQSQEVTSVNKSPQNAEEPLVVLLPREDNPPPLPPRQVYPELDPAVDFSELKQTLPAVREPFELPSIVEPIPEKVKYPDIHEYGATSRVKPATMEYMKECELMSEGQLLEYYQNEQLEFVDDFIDVFVEQELNPHHALFDLLQMYKDVCGKLQLTNDAKQATVEQLTKLNNEVWIVEDKVVNHSGRCGDDRAASGSASYKEAKFFAPKIVELKAKLDELATRELDEALCLEIRARSLALQIQWTVVMINNEFLAELKTSATSLQTLLSTNHCSAKRNQVRGALSDLFYFLRFPALPKRFLDSLYAWVIELTSVLYKACTTNDQMFMLCQVMRTPTPLTPWGSQLIQTFISVPSLDAGKPINSFVALLAIFVQPVKMRGQFLNRLQKYYEGENSWNMISDDGDVDDANFLHLTENDLVAILGQFDMKALFLTATRHFSFVNQTNRRQVMLALIAFTLGVIKLLNEGLATYASYRNVCKKLTSNIRSVCQNLCSYWDLVKEDTGSRNDQRMIQNEINRILLQCMFYIVSKKSAGLWQYLVDFPYSSVTESCRQRCQLLLRSPNSYTIAKLYEIPDEDVVTALRGSGPLVERLLDVSKDDTTFMLSALASVVSQSETDLGYFVDEMIRVCFLDEHTRENYYKVGSEAVAVLIERCPKLLSSILTFIDRNVDHLDQYATDILTNSPLRDCVLSTEDVGSKLAKWLINRPIEHPANHIARRVLTSVNWGSVGQLWMPQEVHDACADAIVKAHIVKCKTRNSLIAKSYKKAASLATKLPDLEHQFDKFCWDVLLRLKFVSKAVNAPPQNDLSAFFVYLMQKCLTTADLFIDTGIKLFHELVNSSCFIPSVVFLARLVNSFPSKIPAFVQNDLFRDCIDKLMHADDSSYAVQLLMGANKFPGPVLKMFLASISYTLSHPSLHSVKDLAIAWLQLITCKKAVDWNMDKPVLCLLGMIVGIAVEKDPENKFGFVEIITDIYRNQLTSWRENSKGLISWFSTQIPPPLLASNLLNVSPWASFILLLSEAKVHAGFYTSLYVGFQKHPQRSLDEHVKKAAAKSHVNLTVDRLDYYRWLELVNSASTTHPAFPLICQQLCISMLERKAAEKKSEKLCPGSLYFRCPLSTDMFTKMRNEVLSSAEKGAGTESLRSFYHAVPMWLFNENLYKPTFNQFHDLILDYLVQMIVSGDRHMWLDLVQMEKVSSKIKTEAKGYSLTCHLDNTISPAYRVSGLKYNSLTDFFNALQTPSMEVEAFPLVPMHEGLPSSDGLSLTDCCSVQYVLQKFAAYFNDLHSIARTFTEGKDNVNTINSKYFELFGKLYTNVQTTLIISMKCGNMFSSKCTRPSSANVTVSSSKYDTKVAAQMNENRQKREEEVGRLLTLLDSTAIKSAHLEFIARIVYLFGVVSKSHNVHFEKVRTTGRTLFYHICQNVTPSSLLFPAGTEAFASSLKCLGSIFIAKEPTEQFALMKIVLGGSPISHYLYEHFTPHCVPADQLFQLYSELSRCVRNQGTSAASLELLSRLDIEHAGDNMPANQFSSLMPIIFENLISANGTNEKLAKLCSDHFVHALFHHFPHNFVNGLALLLSGADTQGIPSDIFQTISDQLKMDVTINENVPTLGKTMLTPDLCSKSIQAMSAQLAKSRRELATRFFSVWAPYLQHVCKYAEYFLKCFVAQTFNSASSTVVIENELATCFKMTLSIWGPLLEPINNGLAPWNPADQFTASVVVEKFVRVLVWFPHSTYLPPGSDTIENLFWEYFATKLMLLQRGGTAHVYPVYEEKIVSLNWARFWPTLLSLSAMDKLVTDGPVEAGPIITEIFIRIPWQQLVSQNQDQPVDAHRAFHSLLLSLLANCVHRPANYAKSRASLERLLGSFMHLCQWNFVRADTAEKLSSFIVSHFPNDTLESPPEAVKLFMSIWRQALYFSTTQIKTTSKAVDTEVVRKQASYLRTDLRLMLKTSWQLSDILKHYREMLTKVDLIIGSGDRTQFVPLAKEATSFLSEVSKEKMQLAFFKTLGEWLKDHSESGIVLLIMHTVMDTFASSHIPYGVKVLNKCIKAYFNRKGACDWLEVSQWLKMPDKVKEFLFSTPSTDSGIKPYFYVLNVHLIHEMSRLQSVQAETALLKKLQEYLQNIKPKYIKPRREPGFLLCLEKLHRMVIRQYQNGVNVAIANENLENLLSLLKKMHTEERGISFLSVVRFGKKPSFPIKLQLFSTILFLYLSQQQTSPGQAPRLQPKQGVLNSKVQTYKDLQNNKQYSEYLNVFQFALPYFTQVEAYNLNNSATLLAKMAQFLYSNDKTLSKLDV